MGDECCSICWDEISDPSVTLECKHKFHYRCITEWAKRNNGCPMCRQTFTEPPSSSDGSADVLWVEDGEIRGEMLLTMVLSSVTVLRGLAIMCPNFVERLFEPQIKLGRSLGDFWKRYRTLAPTLLAALLICSV